MITQESLPITAAGVVVGHLRVRCLPAKTEWQGQALITDDPLPGEAAIQLLEESEYAYEVAFDASQVELQPAELFDASDSSQKSGRLRPRRATGTVDVSVMVDGAVAGTCEFDVRPRKLRHATEYRWMLDGLSESAVELAEAAFSPSKLTALRPVDSGDSRTLYQRFAFVQSYLQSERFVDAIQQILRQPHHEYRATRVETVPSKGLRADGTMVRQLAAPGPRTKLPDGVSVAGLTTLPRRLTHTVHTESVDTMPNQFVKHALGEWRAVARSVVDVLETRGDVAARRGVREGRVVEETLSAVLRAPLFQDVSDPRTLPYGNTVLQGRAGYRDLLRAHLQSRAAATIDWAGSEDVFSAGQRDVAALYEQWVFLELARVLNGLPGVELHSRRLFQVSRDRLALNLRRGSGAVLIGETVVRGHRIRLDLWFNRTFSPSTVVGNSWTEQLRPDCSLRLRRARAGETLDRWLHFDAKYRLNRYTDIFEPAAESESDPASTEVVSPSVAEDAPVSADLLKMHAYRDAIRRTSGAYVLYPVATDKAVQRTRYHEVLPGLGAFVLRPAADGHADGAGASALATFVRDVIDHFAASGTDEERAEYWTTRTYDERRGRRVPRSPTTVPPADARTLLGFLRSPAHEAWVIGRSLYNLRADDRQGSVTLQSPEVSPEIVVLYRGDTSEVVVRRATGALRILTGDDLRRLGYPDPRGELYCCLELDPAELDIDGISGTKVRELARALAGSRPPGAPVVAAWLDIVAG